MGVVVAMQRSAARWSGLAVMIGGMMWVYKGTVILLGISDPGWMVISSQALLAFAIPGVLGAAGGQPGAAGRAGLWLARLSILLGLFHTVWEFLLAQGETPVIINIAIAAGTLGLIAGLIFAGLAVRRSSLEPALLRSFPLAFGVLIIPVMMLGALLIHEEAPIIGLGLAWIWLGALLTAPAKTVSA